MNSNVDNVLEVEELRVYFYTDEGTARAVDGVSFSVRRGSLVAIVGESGCGKTVTAYSILRLIQDPGRIVDGSIRLARQDKPVVDIVGLDNDSEELYDLRGGAVSMIFQEPMTALSPVHTIGDQISEGVLLHQNVTEDEARQRAIDMLAKGLLPMDQILTHRLPLENFHEGIDLVAAGDRSIKVSLAP